MWQCVDYVSQMGFQCVHRFDADRQLFGFDGGKFFLQPQHQIDHFDFRLVGNELEQIGSCHALCVQSFDFVAHFTQSAFVPACKVGTAEKLSIQLLPVALDSGRQLRSGHVQGAQKVVRVERSQQRKGTIWGDVLLQRHQRGQISFQRYEKTLSQLLKVLGQDDILHFRHATAFDALEQLFQNDAVLLQERFVLCVQAGLVVQCFQVFGFLNFDFFDLFCRKTESN